MDYHDPRRKSVAVLTPSGKMGLFNKQNVVNNLGVIRIPGG